MKQKNRYDAFIEDLTIRFSNIPNFNLIQDDESGRRLFWFFVKRIAELHSFKVLFLNHYLPQASKAIADDLNELSKSRYNQFLEMSRDEIRENYFETVRLGYVGLFHKYENFISDLIHQTEQYLLDEWQISESLANYIKSNFDYDLNNWRSSALIHRINWICNCVKHKDGYPTKPDKPASLTHLPENEKIKITKDDLKSDIVNLEQHYVIMLSVLLYIALFRSTLDDSLKQSTFGNEGCQQAKRLITEMISKLL